jgi:DNA repair protein RadA/Sms
VGHVTKDGSLAGPKLLEHMVDAVFYFESLHEGALRILRTQKNRFGSANESAVFEMSEDGLVEVLNPSEQFLSERQRGVSGTSVAALVDGTRCFLVEIQALVQRCFQGFPRRTFQGIDQNRVALLLAVLEKYGIDFSNYDVYVKVAAGGRIEEAAADLAIAAALASARLDKSIPEDVLLLGEVSLTGGIRSVQHLDIRSKEASRMGFKKIIVSESGNSKKISVPMGAQVLKIKNIAQLKDQLWAKSYSAVNKEVGA